MSKKIRTEKDRTVDGAKVYKPKSYHLCQNSFCNQPALLGSAYCRHCAEYEAMVREESVMRDE